jgi:hypothetical protein
MRKASPWTSTSTGREMTTASPVRACLTSALAAARVFRSIASRRLGSGLTTTRVSNAGVTQAIAANAGSAELWPSALRAQSAVLVTGR